VTGSPTGEPTPPEEPFDTWQVGASPLPLRADGFGQVLPTPPELRVRRLRTVDVLPPPTSDRFESSVGPVTPAFVRRTELAWSPGCPVGLEELRELRVTFVGFDGRPHTGQLVVNAAVAEDVVEVFRTLHEARFPLEEVRLVTQADLDAPPTGDGNTTAAYACRPSVGTASWSAHAYGLAVDVNPFVNPYTKGDLVLPELASAYTDRDWRRPGMIHRDGVVVRAFERVGWTWGGTFSSVSDLHHFSANGR
jgi:D-alanyl-D-alanine carboxypeptidase